MSSYTKCFVSVMAASVWWVTPASADITFAQWAAGPADGRAIYVAGVLETVGVYSEVLGFKDRWRKCLADRHLSYGGVGIAAVEYAKSHPLMNTQPAPAVFIIYMNEICGLNALRGPP
jgi:hypothetical protein